MGLRDVATRAVDEVLELPIAPSFSRIGYSVRRRMHAWSEVDADLTGKTVLITGASSGLGRAAALELAELGAELLLVGRNRERLDRVCAECRQRGRPDQQIEGLIADLADLEAVGALVDAVAQVTDQLDVLIHNAGALVDQYAQGSSGHEQTYTAQVLAPHLLTAELLPLLERAPDPRVIIVSSGGMYSERLRPDRMELGERDFDGVRAYALAKRVQVELVGQWAQRYPRISFAAMHPGWADTPGVATSLPTFRRITGPFLRTPEQGADTVVWLAATPRWPGGSGQFWLDRAPRSTVKLPWTACSPQDREEMWDLVCQQSGMRPGEQATSPDARPG